MSLADLVDQGVGGFSRPELYYNLQRLVQAGLVERSGSQKNARYAPEERLGSYGYFRDFTNAEVQNAIEWASIMLEAAQSYPDFPFHPPRTDSTT